MKQTANKPNRNGLVTREEPRINRPQEIILKHVVEFESRDEKVIRVVTENVRSFDDAYGAMQFAIDNNT